MTWYPGVTTVLKQVDKSGAFWAAASRIVATKAVRELDRLMDIVDRDGPESAIDWLKASTKDKTAKAAATGTAVHAYAEAEASGQMAMLDDDIAPYVTQYRSGWIERYRPEFEHVEGMVFSERGRYGGTFDAIVTIKTCPGADAAGPCINAVHHPHRWLIDYKTSADKRIGSGVSQFPYVEAGLQLAALGYADFIGIPPELERSEDHQYQWHDGARYPIPPIDHYGVVAITPTDCQLIEFDVTEQDFYAFMYLRHIHEWSVTRRKEIKR